MALPDLASPHLSSGFGTNKTQTIQMGLALKRRSNRGETFYTNHIMNYGGMESMVKSSARMGIPNRISKPSPALWIWESQIVYRKYLGNILQECSRKHIFLAFFNPSLLLVPARLRSGIYVEEDSPLELLIILKANKQSAFLLKGNKKRIYCWRIFNKRSLSGTWVSAQANPRSPWIPALTP